MSGTPIVSEWHLVSFRVPIVSLFHCIFHIFSMVIGATGQAEVRRSVDDSQASQGSVEGMFCLWVLSSDRSNWKQLDGIKMDGGKTETDEDEDADGHKRPCCIY